jgi:glucosamine kinase
MGNDLNQKLGDEEALVVGLDAGGTRTRAVLAAAADGRPLGEGAAGPGNALTVPVPQLTDHLAEAVARAVPERLRGRVVAVTGGFAGATAASPDDPGHVKARHALTAALRGLGIPPGPVGICSDIEAAFAAAPGTPADGLALVAGTGAVAMRITDRHGTATVDGDGWLLGDDGSGFWIGRAAVRAALRMADGRGPATVLAGTVGRALGLPGEVLPTETLPTEAQATEMLPTDALSKEMPPTDALPTELLPGEALPPETPPTDALPGEALPPETPPTEALSKEMPPTELLPAEALSKEMPPTDALPGEASPAGQWSRVEREAYRMHLLPAVMADPPIRLARFAPLVAEAAAEKDPVAEAILDEAADRLTDTVRALAPRPGERIVATGGLLGPDGPLTPRLTARLKTLGLRLDWVADGSRGAVALARLTHGGGR